MREYCNLYDVSDHFQCFLTFSSILLKVKCSKFFTKTLFL
ncbi:hypothetical protein P689_12266 [Candidatus Riesia pediculischaeffi PTSU]|uniref:Uncharacterized protein n=1 Tax=Candidatus Riesia pediculischaeffi PTSU TaxID=1401651 RepID=A0A0C1S011_9ENTR|nr:hypothetical protein P689_12266 [Candidatus Riesia pediculischaeffi PTSU]